MIPKKPDLTSLTPEAQKEVRKVYERNISDLELITKNYKVIVEKHIDLLNFAYKGWIEQRTLAEQKSLEDPKGANTRVFHELEMKFLSAYIETLNNYKYSVDVYRRSLDSLGANEENLKSLDLLRDGKFNFDLDGYDIFKSLKLPGFPKRNDDDGENKN